MNRPTDQQLLNDYAATREEAAFTELVRRHVDLVYSAALRMVRDAHLAQDVTQSVFVALSKSASQLTQRPVLSGWLHRTAQNLAANVIRTEVRRRAREQEAATMNELLAHEPDADWKNIAPHLDTALGELSEPDRDALLLRYFERKSAREMAQVLNVSEEAAQKRVNRAVERLRELFSKQNVTIGSSGLVVLISTNAVQAAPVGLFTSISSAVVVAQTTLQTSTTIAATKTIAMTTLQKTLIITAAVATVGTLVVQRQSQHRLRTENELLCKELAQAHSENAGLSNRFARITSPVVHLPPPPANISEASSAAAETTWATVQGGLAQKPLRLTGEQAETFLAENRRDAASLLAVFRTTSDAAYLKEAMRNFPDDPQVAFEAAMRTNTSPEEKRRWLDALKESDPENSFGNYLSALAYFNTGEWDQAVQELVAASGKSRFTDYGPHRLQANEEAYRSSGYSEAEIRLAAISGLELPQLYSFRDLHGRMLDLATSYRQAGDEASSQAVLQMIVNMGERFDGSKGAAGTPAALRIVSLDIQRRALEAMNPATPFGPNGATAKDQLERIAHERAALAELCRQFDFLYQKAPVEEMINYIERSQRFGEEAALAWLKRKYGVMMPPAPIADC